LIGFDGEQSWSMNGMVTNQPLQAAGTLWQRRGKQPLKALRSPMVVRHRLLGRFRTSPHPEPSHSHPGAANLSESHASVADLLGRHVRGTSPQHVWYMAGLASLAVPDVPTCLRQPGYPICEQFVRCRLSCPVRDVVSPVLFSFSSVLRSRVDLTAESSKTCAPGLMLCISM
jgi:hypothetical protein